MVPKESTSENTATTCFWTESLIYVIELSLTIVVNRRDVFNLMVALKFIALWRKMNLFGLITHWYLVDRSLRFVFMIIKCKKNYLVPPLLTL